METINDDEFILIASYLTVGDLINLWHTNNSALVMLIHRNLKFCLDKNIFHLCNITNHYPYGLNENYSNYCGHFLCFKIKFDRELFNYTNLSLNRASIRTLHWFNTAWWNAGPTTNALKYLYENLGGFFGSTLLNCDSSSPSSFTTPGPTSCTTTSYRRDVIKKAIFYQQVFDNENPALITFTCGGGSSSSGSIWELKLALYNGWVISADCVLKLIQKNDISCLKLLMDNGALQIKNVFLSQCAKYNRLQLLIFFYLHLLPLLDQTSSSSSSYWYSEDLLAFINYSSSPTNINLFTRTVLTL